MARKTAGGRKGAVTGRVQVRNPVTKRWVKVNTKTGRIVSVKKTPGPYRGIRKK